MLTMFVKKPLRPYLCLTWADKEIRTPTLSLEDWCANRWTLHPQVCPLFCYQVSVALRRWIYSNTSCSRCQLVFQVFLELLQLLYLPRFPLVDVTIIAYLDYHVNSVSKRLESLLCRSWSVFFIWNDTRILLYHDCFVNSEFKSGKL